ncbi:MAG: acyl-CoA dehydrogenase family protein [Alphaproteobacteria bacterium]|jgi:alkylation response protein AidB-like acyl-CoA dehydrogenase
MEEMFIQTEEQRAILDSVRRFVEEEVTPRAAELDANKDPEDSFSWEIVEAADRFGLRTMTLDEEYGGLAADMLTTSMVIEELGRGDLGTSVVFAQTLKIAKFMQNVFNDDQKKRVLEPFRDDPRAVLSICSTEPDHGSDSILLHPVQYNTRAVKVDGGWVANGMKHFISNSNRSRFYLVFMQTDFDKSLVDGATCFLLERDHPGFTIGRVHDKMGERLANNAELFFTDCFIPDENVVGEPHGGQQLKRGFGPSSNIYAGASILGVADALYEKSLSWAQTRVQGGKPLIEHDGIRAQLAEMKMLTDVARSYIHRAAYLGDHQEEGWEASLASMPKIIASQVAWKLAGWTLELHGGYGYMKETGVEKLVRDAAAFLHSDGVNRTLLLRAANSMWG